MRLIRPVVFTVAFLGATVALMAIDLSPRAPDAPDAVRADDPLTDLSFMCGSWRARLDGDIAEEHWSDPVGGHIVGMFRWLGDGQIPRVLELETITMRVPDDDPESKAVPTLCFRHLAPADLAPLEDKAFRLRIESLDTKAKRVVWRNADEESPLETITYHRHADDAMTARVDFRADSGRAPITLEFKRVRPGS